MTNMTNAITTYITIHAKKIMLVAALAVALTFSVGIANAEVKNTTSTFGIGDTDAAEGLGLGETKLDEAVVGLINVALGFLGLIAVVIILIGGFKWMTAGGNEDKVGEARKTIFAGIIGLAIILFAWGITTFVVQELGKASGLSGGVFDA